MSILDHRWGKSDGADKVWALVAGYGPSKSAGRVLVNLQAMIDDSRDEGGIFALAGYISSAERWAAFSVEWEGLLPLATVSRKGKPRFKMAEMALSPEKMSNVPAFFRVIEKHVMASVSAKISVRDLELVQKRIFVPGKDIDWAFYANPYYICFRVLMDKFHSIRAEMDFIFGKERKIDFIFDDQSEKKNILEGWEEYLKGRPDEIRDYYGDTPAFKNDEDFLPLQSADFWAWWVRKWHKDGTPEKVMEWAFNGFSKSPEYKHLRIDIEFNQDDLMKSMMGVLRGQLGPDQPLIDLRALDRFGGG